MGQPLPALPRSTRWRRSATRTVAVGLLALVAVTSTSLAEVAALPGAAPRVQAVAATAAVTAPPVTEQPDRHTAALAAYRQKSRVLIAGETTETSLTYANPDGSFTMETNPSPVRVQQGGDWHAIDTTLVERDGVLVPKMAKGEVEISAGGDEAPMARIEHAGDASFALSWPKALPTPKVEGNKATYTDAAGPGADLVVTALPTGFRHDVVLRERPAGPVEYKLEVDTDGLKLAETKTGSLTLTDEDGKTVASAPQPVMYEAAAEQPDATAETTADAAAPSEIDTRVATENGRQLLVLKPDPAFLSDPDTQYPVVVDPTTTLGVTTDGFVRSHIADMANGDYLKVGSSDGGDTKQRSLIKFNVASLAGKHVTAAEMRLWTANLWTTDQNGPGVIARRLSANWSTATTHWGQQPGAYATGAVTVKSAYDSTWMKFPITTIAQAWAAGSPNYGVHVVGASETDIRSARWFHSANYSAGGTAHPPALVVTYNSYPATATTKTVGVSTGTDGVAYSTATPRLYGAAKDADGGVSRVYFEVSDTAGTVLWTGSVSGLVAGTQGAVTVPAGKLAHGQKWRWRARGFDGLDYGPWSGYLSYTVDAEVPAAPTIDCPDYPADAWTPSTGGEVTCTLDTTSADGSGYYWALDDDNPTTLAADPDGKGGDPLTITIDPEDGQHILYAKSRDVALQTSETTVYSFGVGTEPTPVLDLSALASEPGEELIVTVANAPDNVTSATVTSSAFADGPITLMRGNAEESLSGTAMIMNGIKPGTYDVSATFDAQEEPLTILLDVNGPGRIDAASGAFIVTSTDFSQDGLLITRSHSVSTSSKDSPHQKIFGSGWQAEILGGMIDSRLESSTGEPSFFRLTAPSGETTTYTLDADDSAGMTYVAADGSTLVMQTPERYIEHRAIGIEIEWVYQDLGNGARWFATAVGDADAGMIVVSYDQHDRVVGLSGPKEGISTPTICPGPGCASIVLTYANITTATDEAFGDHSGRLKNITYTADEGLDPRIVHQYRYDVSGQLRTVTDEESASQTSYVYDDGGYLTQLIDDVADWSFTYDSDGRMVRQEKVGLTSDSFMASSSASTSATNRNCKYMSQFLWGDGKNTCWVSPVPMEYGGKGYKPTWRRTPGGKGVSKSVVGVTHDHCTGIADQPRGFDFRVACDMHDYGYGIIYKSPDDSWKKSHKSQVDNVFYTTLRDYVCNAYTEKQKCKGRAYDYYLGVRNLGGWGM
ncbi:phospholipase A2 [Planomonospora sp. ID82291]|uniref:phospholipase A2 n=1 Tax=Planomonospora sp. ID82291 TaxID=2738136 RepID=UPI0018C377F2|nr:phospholipase A2 [Planomonospora sp. ID82291]MBG0814278.1 DNRLRE domain-containing protein [Planomonospora sp. ID82291]